jgi:hypothetical protein
MMRAYRKVALLGLLGLAALAVVAAGVRAEVVQEGNLRIAVTGSFSPKRLPRTAAAPIAVTVGGRIATLDGNLPPQLKRLRIELNRHGRLDTRGLPRCRLGQIQPASTAHALHACRRALVGRGSFSVEVVLGTQVPYATTGRLLVFNGSYEGHPALLGQIYSAHPFANSFVIPFQVEQRVHGRFGVVLTARLPRAFTEWGYVTGLEMRLWRRYTYHGRRNSFLSAGCPAAHGFSDAAFTLADATFTFADGRNLSSTLAGNCTVRR